MEKIGQGKSRGGVFLNWSLVLSTLMKKALENNVGKGKNAGNQHFLLFPQCFYPMKDKS